MSVSLQEQRGVGPSVTTLEGTEQRRGDAMGGLRTAKGCFREAVSALALTFPPGLRLLEAGANLAFRSGTNPMRFDLVAFCVAGAFSSVTAAACSSADPGSLASRRASLGPGGSIDMGVPDSGASTSNGGTTTSSGSSSGGSSSGGAGSDGASSGSSSSGASSGSTGGGSGGTSDDAGASAEFLQHCVDDINMYRATIGVPPYTRSSSLESFAAQGSESDAMTGEAHGNFISTNGGNGIAYAENEIPGWPLDQYGSVTAITDQGMQMMWAEGPGGGHYDNMASTMYTQAGCGTYTTSDGSVWITTDFR
jgi:uncharacterized protein YkwD